MSRVQNFILKGRRGFLVCALGRAVNRLRWSVILCSLAWSSLACQEMSREERAEHLGEQISRLIDEENYEEALPLAEDLVENQKILFGAEDTETAHCLVVLGFALVKTEQPRRAIPHFEEALGIFRQAGSREDLVPTLSHLRMAWLKLDEPDRAASYATRAVRLAQEIHGPTHPRTVDSLSHLGSVRLVQGAALQDQGKLAEARMLYEESLKLHQDARGADHPATAVPLTNLGNVSKALGDLKSSLEFYERALAIRESKLGPDHSKTAAALNNLAAVVNELGDLPRARELYERALAIRRAVLEPNAPELAVSLNNLGLMAFAMGDPELALKLLLEALAIREEIHPPDDPEIATVLANLAPLFRLVEDVESELRYLERALAIRQKSLGEVHLDTAISHFNLGMFFHMQEDIDRARRHFGRAHSIRETLLGPEHRKTVSCLLSLAAVEEMAGRTERAVTLTREVVRAHELWLAPLLETGSDTDRRLLLRTQRGIADRAVSLHLRSVPAHREAARLALTMILRDKGRALEATTASRARLRRVEGEEGTLWDAVKSLRGEQSVLMLRPPAELGPAELEARRIELAAEIRTLESRIAAHSAEVEATRPAPLRIAALQREIPPDSALLEFFIFQPFEAAGHLTPWRAPRYAVYILTRRGEPIGLDLGPADVLETQVDAFRSVLENPASEWRAASQELYRTLMGNIRPHLGNVANLFVSPDGALNSVPFAALLDSKGQYLLEHYRISYLPSGRDLLIPAEPAVAREPPLVVGGADFDFVPTAWNAPERGTRDHLIERFEMLSGTAAEARSVALLLGLGEERVLTGEAATEAAVKAVRGPLILHLATHGFFLPELPLPRQERPWDDLLSERAAESRDDALLRSGLALTGYNRRRAAPGADDGVLTALEVSALDLRGTQVVVLSACETALGEIRTGQGVFGLRRALALAGARSQMTTLWRVADEPTRALVEGWYTTLAKGRGRAEALREVQLAFLRGEPRPPVAPGEQRGVRPKHRTMAMGSVAGGLRHPYYWASFVLLGEVGPVAGLAR